jgi:hypothetical protein
MAVSGASFDFRFAADGATEVACFYFDVISGGTTIGTHGSTTPGTATSPWCTNGAEKLVSTPLPEVTTTTIANGLRIKVYGYESNRRPIDVDQATVSGTASGQAFTLYETSGVDAADTSPQTRPWTLAAADGTFYTNTNNWPSGAFTTTRYLQYTFPSGYVPSSATIDDVTLDHRYQANSGSTICFYAEALSGGTSLGTVPSPVGADGVSCAAGTGSWVSDSLDLSMVDTPAEVNGLTVRVFYRRKTGGATKAREDYVNLNVTYH